VHSACADLVGIEPLPKVIAILSEGRAVISLRSSAVKT
jgi:hypothetical protein